MSSPFPEKIDGIDLLLELALDLRWSWNHAGDIIWRTLDLELWELTSNPYVVLKTCSREKLKQCLSDPSFRKKINELISKKQDYCTCSAWFQNTYPTSDLNAVAYFSMEFMLSEALPIYCGGLGNVAGDQLKAASDLGVPVIGIGLLYQQGYFRQVINKDGEQLSFFPYNDPYELPITPLRKPSGEWLRLEIELPGWPLWIRAWQAQVGRLKLYLLDTNDSANFPPHRGITSELYGGTEELRLKQELVLGIGGVKLLEALKIRPEVYHLNEGHAAFAVLERAKILMQEHNMSFEVALAAARAGTLFTTHTAVPAGFDRFSPALIEQYLAKYAQSQLNISFHDLLALGRQNPNDATQYFNMAFLAVRASGAVNGVSALHGKVSRRIFAPLFPRWPEVEIPVSHVTNGVHMPSWDSEEADALWTEYCGKERWLAETEELQQEIRKIPDERIWQMRHEARKNLVDYACGQLSKQLAARGATKEEVERAKTLFDPEALTIGFARRFASYKRPNLLLNDRDRLIHILTNAKLPVQIVIAGKAHPQDKVGQELIHDWMQFIRRIEARHHVIFLSDYDMKLTEKLVQGVDVWLNTPRRPWEACGTSGMKVLVNGGLNVSELDGWWQEAFREDIGWALEANIVSRNDEEQDRYEAGLLYDLLEKSVIPEFYERHENGVPERWVAKIRESMARLTPYFSANRAVREYTEKHYLVRAKSYKERVQEGCAAAKKFVEWHHMIKEKWSLVRFVEVKVDTQERHGFVVLLFLGEISPNDVKVELYADVAENVPYRQELTCIGEAESPGTYVFRGKVSTARLISDFTPRVVATFPGAATPLEVAEITWQR